MRLAGLACLIGLMTLPGLGRAEGKPKVAVMTLADQTRTLGEGLLESLTDALRTPLAQSGQFVVIDKSRQAAALRKLVREQKRESYKSCYDSRCQIPLGQALAADSILRTKVTQVGSTYLMNAELVDLAKEAVTGAAQARVLVKPRADRDDRLLRAMSELARQLSSGGTPSPETTPPPPVEVRPVPPVPPPPPVRTETPEELRRRQEELHQRQAEAQARAEEARREGAFRAHQEAARRRRVSYMIYGWGGLITGAILAGSGAYYVTAKLSDAKDKANNAEGASAFDAAIGEAKSTRTTGIVCISLGGIAMAIGAALILAAPRVPERPINVAGVHLDRSPRGGVGPGGVAVSWGGRF